MSKSNAGFVAIPKLILQNSCLTPDAIVLYLNLLHFDREGGKGCFCKRSTLSKFSNLSLHKVRNAIKVLEDNGIISVVRRRNSLTDVIRITPDCRPPIKEVPKRAPKSRKPAHHIKPILTSRNTQEIKNFNVSTNRDNKTIQVNNTLSANNPEGFPTTNQNNHKHRVKQKQIAPLEPLPIQLHQRATNELLSQIKPLIRKKSYEVWFADCSVYDETETEVILHTAKGSYVADYIKFKYLSKLEAITHKQVRIIG